MDRSVVEMNTESRRRLATVGEGLSGDDLVRTIDGSWTPGALFAHIAFWDRFHLARWMSAHRSGIRTPVPLDDAVLDLVNEAALPQWTALPPATVVRDCLVAAETIDALIESLTGDILSELVAEGRERLAYRSRHRNEHLDAIEAALSTR